MLYWPAWAVALACAIYWSNLGKENYYFVPQGNLPRLSNNCWTLTDNERPRYIAAAKCSLSYLNMPTLWLSSATLQGPLQLKQYEAYLLTKANYRQQLGIKQAHNLHHINKEIIAKQD